jgi:hypothetical protein
VDLFFFLFTPSPKVKREEIPSRAASSITFTLSDERKPDREENRIQLPGFHLEIIENLPGCYLFLL